MIWETVFNFLSGGEKRKLAIAGVLAMEPELLVLDEPFAGLDLPGVQMILRAITTLHAQGKTIMVITHDIEKVLAHATRLIILDRGKLVRNGTPAEVAPDLPQFGVRGIPAGKPLESVTWLA